MNRKFLISALIIFFWGCDAWCFTEIVNKTDENITVTLFFDEKMLDKNALGKPVDNFRSIKYYNEKLNVTVHFDSINLSTTFILLPNQKSNILKTVGGIGVTPDFSFFKEITIETSKLKKSYKVQKFDSIFKKNETDDWQFVVE